MRPFQPLAVATYNVRACRGIDGRRSEERIGGVIAELNVDVIGLQELDLNRRRSNRADQAGTIAKHLGWNYSFCAAMQRGTEQYGDAILSRYAFEIRQARGLPSVMTRICPETRAAMWIAVETATDVVHIINTHLGLGRRERLMQAQLLAGPEWLGQIENDLPTVLLGDFNSRPGSPPFRVLTEKLQDARASLKPLPDLRAFPTRFPLLAVDHIFINKRFRVESLAAIRTPEARMASDHFPVVAKLSLMPSAQK